MNISTIIFTILGFVALLVGFALEGGSPGALISKSAAIIVFGGTLGAVGLSFPISEVKRIPKVLKMFFSNEKKDLVELIILFRDLSMKTRKNGLLSIEGEVVTSDIDPFIKKGLQLVVDGVEPQAIQGILELEAETMSDRHRKIATLFESAGGYAPTMGIVGTVLGLIQILGSLSDPASLGEKIAPAFIATLYGISSANLLWLPIGNKLKVLDDYEMLEKSLIIEAVLLIQTGVNPSTLTEKLKGFLNKEELQKFETMNKVSEE
jgi:Flagellar motor component